MVHNASRALHVVSVPKVPKRLVAPRQCLRVKGFCVINNAVSEQPTRLVLFGGKDNVTMCNVSAFEIFFQLHSRSNR